VKVEKLKQILTNHTNCSFKYMPRLLEKTQTLVWNTHHDHYTIISVMACVFSKLSSLFLKTLACVLFHLLLSL